MPVYTNQRDPEFSNDYGLILTAQVAANVPLSSKTTVNISIRTWYGYVNYLDYVTVGISGGPSATISRGSGGHSGSSDDPISTNSFEGSVNLEWDPATMNSCNVYALPHIDYSYSGNTPERLYVEIPVKQNGPPTGSISASLSGISASPCQSPSWNNSRISRSSGCLCARASWRQPRWAYRR